MLTSRHPAGAAPKENTVPTAPQSHRDRRPPKPTWGTSDAEQFAQRPANAPAGAYEYPESDGKPMAETGLHWRAILDVATPLVSRYADRSDVYVGGDTMMYYIEGNREVSISPDVFVAFGSSREPVRRVWKTWEEGKLADFVLEVASKKTHGRDEREKRALYQSLGIAEYWQFDATGEYLSPVLQGRRLNAARAYEILPLATTPEGGLRGVCQVLGLHIYADGSRLRLFDPATGRFLLNHLEHTRASEEKDDTIAEERRARQAAEAELAELKRQLAGR